MSRIVMFVFNDCTTDARVLREAGSLAAAGHEVTIMARPRDVTSTVQERERRDGFEIVRVPLPAKWKRFYGLARRPWRARGWLRFRFFWDLRKGPGKWPEAFLILAATIIGLPWVTVHYLLYRLGHVGGRKPSLNGTTLDWLIRWRFSSVGWAYAAAGVAPVADAYHGHDLTGLPGALRAARIHRATRPAVVYDSHEIYVDSGRIARLPRVVRRLLAWQERRWVSRTDAMVTVNTSLAEELGRRYRPRRIVVVRNCPSRWDLPDPRPDLLRAAAGIAAGAPVALYHGGFSAHRGMEQLAEAILEPGLEHVHAVFMGYGSERARLDGRAAESRFGGRLHVLDAVPPAALPPWVASADVGVMPIQRSTLNHYLSTPNKLFESLAAGVPVVVSDFPEMHRIVLDDPDAPLGATCNEADPASIACAIRSVLELSPDALNDLRRRCLKAAHERYNWETEFGRLLGLYDELMASTRASPAEVGTAAGIGYTNQDEAPAAAAAALDDPPPA